MNFLTSSLLLFSWRPIRWCSSLPSPACPGPPVVSFTHPFFLPTRKEGRLSSPVTSPTSLPFLLPSFHPPIPSLLSSLLLAIIVVVVFVVVVFVIVLVISWFYFSSLSLLTAQIAPYYSGGMAVCIYLLLSLCVCLSGCLYICMYVCFSVSPSVCKCVYFSVFICLSYALMISFGSLDGLVAASSASCFWVFVWRLTD